MKMQLNILQTKKKKKIVITFKVPIVFPSRVILIFLKNIKSGFLINGH